MNKKNFLTGIITMTAVAVLHTAAHSAMSIERQQELCNKSKNKVWDEYSSVCVPENACKNDKYVGHCQSVFSDIDMFTYDENNQKNNLDDVVDAMNFYVRRAMQMNYECDKKTLRYPIERTSDDNFVGCKFGPHYMTFKLGSNIVVDDKVLAGKCYTFGGHSTYLLNATGVNMGCEGISKTHCDELGGEYITEVDGYEVKECVIKIDNK